MFKQLSKKQFWRHDVYKSTYKNPKRGIAQIAKTAASIETGIFRSEYFDKEPVVIRQAFENLHARWWANDDFDALNKFGSRIVPVEVSRQSASYSSIEDHNQTFEAIEVPLSLFLRYLTAYKQHGADKESPKLYLAQCALFDIIPEIYASVCQANFVPNKAAGRQVPRFSMVGRGDIYNINAWLGIDTHTPLHCDPYHNIYAQLISDKQVMIIPPQGRRHLALHEDHLLKNTSTIPDAFDSLPPSVADCALEATLSPGDGLYIPQGWYHTFKGDAGISASANWWFR